MEYYPLYVCILAICAVYGISMYLCYVGYVCVGAVCLANMVYALSTYSWCVCV